VVIFAAALLYFSYGRKSLIRSKDEVIAKYTTPNSHFLDWKGARMHYTDNGSGPLVLMIHGFGGSFMDFAMLDSLIRDNYRVIRVDLPGFGLSDFPDVGDKPDYQKLYTDYFNFFLDTLHIDTMYLAGNSMGGMMSWVITNEHPEKVKKLVLLNSAGYDMDQTIKKLKFNNTWLQTLFHRGIPNYVIASALKNIFYTTNANTTFKTDRTADFWNKEGNLDVIFSLATSHAFPDTALITSIHCPTLIIWGKQDNLIPCTAADKFHRDIANSRVIVYDSCGHAPMIERPVEVSRDVARFFSE
jgi:pimeloyl-ACP methyl ester carboxylesterase